jgi:hypothetical protein
VTRWLMTFVVLSLVLGCDERGGGGTVVPHGRGNDSGLRPEGEPEGESMDELALRLDKLVGDQPRLLAVSDDEPNKCEALCELSRAICEIKTKMCSIAEERVTDDEYQDLCRTAKQRCSDASDSCTRCVERSEGRGGGTCEGAPAR